MARKRPRNPAARSGEPRRDRVIAAEPAWSGFFDRHGIWVALAAVSLLLVVFFYPIFFQGQTFQPPDQIASLAHTTLVKDAFASPGSFFDRYPLWTPYVFSGMPSFGSMIAAPFTNPLYLVFFWVPMWARVVVFYLLVGVFTWMFLRRHQVGTLASLFGATAYIFCAHVITWIMFGHNTKPSSLVFLPLVLMATDELWERPTLRWTALLGLSTAMLLLAHHYQVAFYVMAAAGLYLILAVLRSAREIGVIGVVARVATWGIGIAVGFAGSAMLYLPVHEYAEHSIRGGESGGLTYAYATNWSLHPLETITFLVPSFMGFGSQTYWGWMPFTDFPHYMGILVLVLAVITAVVWFRERLVLYLSVLAVLTLLLAFGKHLPLLYGPMFKLFPYFDKFRVPSMILLLTQFAVAILAALGLHRLVTAGETDRRRFARLLLWTAGIAGALVLVLGGLVASGALDGTIVPRLAERAATYGVPLDRRASFGAQMADQVSTMVGRDMLVVLIVLGAGTLLLTSRLKGRIPAAWAVLGILGLTLLDLWWVDHRPAQYYPRTGDRTFDATPAVQFLQQDPGPYRILPLTGEGRNNNWFAYFGISSVLGYHPAKLRIYQDLINEEGPAGISKSLSTGNFNIVNMLNMKYVVSDQEISGGPLTTVHRGRQFVIENRNVLPRMWFVDRARVVEDPPLHLQAVADPTWNPATDALLFEDPGALDPGSGGTARITDSGQRHLTAEVTSPGRSLLVISEIYYDAGWKAWIDGEPAEIHRADYVLRSVVVPQGTHTLEMRFEPSSFRTGVLVTVITFALIFLALGLSFVLERPRARPPAASAAA